MNIDPLEPTPLAYHDLEPFLDAQVADPIPTGVMDPGWLREPEISPEWLREPEISPEWLREPEISPEWLQGIQSETVDRTQDALSLDTNFDLEH